MDADELAQLRDAHSARPHCQTCMQPQRCLIGRLLDEIRVKNPRREPAVHLVGERGFSRCGLVDNAGATEDPSLVTCRSCLRFEPSYGTAMTDSDPRARWDASKGGRYCWCVRDNDGQIILVCEACVKKNARS